jgi:small subunit ribosomal protein S6
MSYETLYVVDGTLASDVIATIVGKFTALINDNATDVVVNEWGNRRLAYPINYKNEGYYVLVNYKSEPTFPLELERVLGITDGIIRSMTTRANGTVVAAPAVAASAPAVEVVEATEAVSEAAEEAAE